MNVLLISNDYNFSEELAQKIRIFDARLSHNNNSYDSFQLLKRNSKSWDLVLVDDNVNDYQLKNIFDLIRMEDIQIPIILLTNGVACSWDNCTRFLESQIVQDVTLRGTDHQDIQMLGQSMLRVYKKSKIYR